MHCTILKLDDQYTHPSDFCVNSNIECNIFWWYGVVFVLLPSRCSFGLVERGHGWHLVGSHTVYHKDIGFLCGTNKKSEERAMITGGRQGEGRRGREGEGRRGREGGRRRDQGRECEGLNKEARERIRSESSTCGCGRGIFA